MTVILSACADATLVTAPDTASLDIDAAAAVTVVQGAGYTRVEGQTGGALWAAIRPDAWNGDLVVLAHGNVSERAPISLNPPLHWFWNPFIAELIDRGFGVAFSSYRVNGFAVAEGTIDTRIAEAAFASRFGQPATTYIAGWSLGTHVGEKLVETSPSRYAGFLSVCGALGGTPIQVRRFLDDRVLFDYFFPGVLTGNVATTDLDWLGFVLPRAIQAVSADFASALKFASVEQTYIRYTNPQELVIAIAASLFGPGSSSVDIQAKSHGLPYDNTNTVYTSSLLSPAELQALNDGVGRFAGDPQALEYMKVNYAPDGGIGSTKILSLHTTRDPLVPSDLHMPAYDAILTSVGRSDQWAIRMVDGFGHCEFGFDSTPDPFIIDLTAAFDDLVTWVRDDVKPAS